MRAAASPCLAITAATIGGKSESAGAIAIFPFHCGCAMSRSDGGSCARGTCAGLYTRLLTRSAMPTQLPAGELTASGT